MLSRSTVFEFKQVPAAEVEKAVLRAVSILSARENVTADIEPGTAGYIASVCGGDVRKALNAVELLFSAAPREGNTIRLLRADAENITQRSAMHYDRAGDDHYDVVSALMKSLRGSDPDAALHYLARLLEAGDLIGACRRILCSASEDIGLAYPQAAMIVKSCVDSALQLGQGRRGPSRVSCRTSMPTARASSVSRATSIRTATRVIGCSSSTCPMS